MKIYIYTLLFCLITISNSTFSQNFNAKITYFANTKTDLDFFKNRKIPEDRKQQIIKMLKENSNKKYTLYIVDHESIYKENEQLESSNSSNKGRYKMFSSMTGNPSGENYYKDLLNKIYSYNIDLYGKPFLINDKLKTYDWNITGETKKIGRYTVIKATAIKKLPIRKKARAKNIKPANSAKKREMRITAWFCPEIPISTGPSQYWGLPGLILEVNNGFSTILCSEILLNPNERIKVKIPSKGKKVTELEYKTIAIKKHKDIMEMRKRNNKARPRNHF
ncbi:MAG: GLPGLI family protein [Marinifilaceae bacterium]|jgi:GLPGLI family protein|nr:GLPGLI family protein [Marinifilaceae bacterium]